MPRLEQDQVIIQELVRRSNDQIRRFRELEQRLQILETRSISLENTVLQKNRSYDRRIAELDVAIKNFGNEIARMKTMVEKINKQILYRSINIKIMYNHEKKPF